jgi:cytochrome c oxidase subunit I
MAIGRKTQGKTTQGTPRSKGLLKRPTAKGLVGWLTTVDHKRLGIMYLVTSFGFFVAGSLEAALMRLQLAFPEQNIIPVDMYNELFTVHGVNMILFAIMPMGVGFANYFVPLMIGARDLAFPRLNALGYWAYLAGGIIFYSSFILGHAPHVGWFAYAPLTQLEFTPGAGTDFYTVGLLISGIGTLITAMNFIVTIINMRAPGMTMLRVPLFPWMILITSFIIIFAFPVITIALAQILLDRTVGTVFYDTTAGALPILWQHLFWIFGHPEVYIVILPAFGILHEVIPTFSRKPLFGYPLIVFAGLFIAFMSFAVWSHHMFTTGLGPIANSAFALTSWIIAVPTGIKIFNWLATMWAGRLRFTTAMLFCIGFIFTFTLGGITGIMVAVPPFDAQAHDSYFVVAHFHYVMAGGALMSFMAGIYYWFPKMRGRYLSERLGKWVFWLIFVGFHTIFFPQHLLGLQGMPRRVQTYEAGIGLELGNLVSSLGALIMGLGGLLFIYSLARDFFKGEKAGADPWDGRTLEWATSSPPPVYNFAELPYIEDRDPVWVRKHPELIRRRDPISKASDDPGRGPLPYHEEGIHLPGQSWFPFVLALGLGIGGYAMIYENYVLAILMVLFIFASVYGWAFEGVDGTTIKLQGERE